jgi:hypothetical protein
MGAFTELRKNIYPETMKSREQDAVTDGLVTVWQQMIDLNFASKWADSKLDADLETDMKCAALLNLTRLYAKWDPKYLKPSEQKDPKKLIASLYSFYQTTISCAFMQTFVAERKERDIRNGTRLPDAQESTDADLEA